jgi:TM2 domain-containing membrane protein YozV
VKETGVAYALWAIGPIFGIHGMHRFYMGQVGMGLLHFFTLGFCGIGWIIDAALIPGLVAETNAIEAGHYHGAQQRGMHFRPAPEYRQQSSGSGIAVAFAVVVGLCLAGCFGFMVLGAFAGARQEAMLEAEMDRAREAEMEARDADYERGRDEPVREVGSSSAHPEVAKLHQATRKLHRVIDTKLQPLIDRFEKDLNDARKDLRRLKPKLKTDKNAKFKAQKLIQECKEIKVFLKKLNVEKDRYQQQVDRLESSTRSLERKLQVAEFLGENDKAELDKLVTLSQTLVEEADKGFKHKEGSLESEVEREEEAADSDLDPELEGELDDVLEDDF